MSGATIVDCEGVFFLCVKNNNETWDRVELPRNYSMAMATIHKHLKSFPIPVLEKLKRLLAKMTKTRKLSLKLRKMTMTVPSKKKTQETRREETSQKSIGSTFLESLKKQPSTFFCPYMLYGDPSLGWEENLETEEERAAKELREDFLLDDPLNADDGDIAEDDEGADTSDQSTRKQPTASGPNLGKSKRIPRMPVENSCPKPSVHKVKHKVTRKRKLQVATGNMNMTVPNGKKTREIRNEETFQKSTENDFLDRLKKQSQTSVYPAMVYHDPDLEAEEEKQAEMEVVSKKLLSSAFPGGFLMDDPLKDVDASDIVEDIEEAGTSDQSIKLQPKVFGPDLGKWKRTPRMLIEDWQHHSTEIFIAL